MRLGGGEIIGAKESEMIAATHGAKALETFFVSSYDTPLGTYTLVI